MTSTSILSSQDDQTEDLTEFINYVARCCEYSLNLHLKAARGEPVDDIEDIDKEIALFKRSLANAPEQAFSASELIDFCLASLPRILPRQGSFCCRTHSEKCGHR